jgi:16S rRNA G966 N2-methylase RsmD
MNDIYFEKVWAMPNSRTFTIKPIKAFVEAEVSRGGTIVDPFANSCKYGTITNDLNPEYKTDYNMDALEFLKSLPDDSTDLVLYDPPYSISQASEMYKSYGKEKLEINVANMKY